jgi:hypothetical protein
MGLEWGAIRNTLGEHIENLKGTWWEQRILSNLVKIVNHTSLNLLHFGLANKNMDVCVALAYQQIIEWASLSPIPYMCP